MLLPYKSFFLFGLVIISCGLLLSCENEADPNHDPALEGPPLFSLLPADSTGIIFQNTLREGLNTNILMYEYFYNGGGVAAGDVNNDGLVDLYFSSNMGSNHLYLNLGNMKFRDIAPQSGAIGRAGPWKTGVNMVDINGDGLLDIYLCYSGALPDAKRANQLFINQGNTSSGTPLFKEQAAEYGLASTAYSNQSYFFDYDKDGDLDMLLLNHNPKSLPVLNVAQSNEFLKIDDPLRGLRLFRQQDAVFEDVTEKTGINGSALSYGLGLGISDINQDGWPDFYVSNDYTVPDYLYINNQDGTFRNTLPESIGHNSQFSMGNDVSDINNDGLPDIFTLDMLPEDNYRQKLLLAPDNYSKFDLSVRSGFHYQYMRNMLQLNNGNGTFSEIGQLAGVSNTDWSWAALLADYDNDGWKDLFISNGYNRDYTNLDFIKYMDDFVRANGRLKRDDVLEIISHMPASNVPNYIFENQEGAGFSKMNREWGFTQPANSNGAVYADLDNDGDLDLAINNINKEAFLYRNETQVEDAHYLQIELIGAGQNTAGIGARIDLYAGQKQQSLEQYPSRGYLSAVSPILHVGLEKVELVDSIQVKWPSGKVEVLRNIAANQKIRVEEKNALNKENEAEQPIKEVFSEQTAILGFAHQASSYRDFDRQSLLIHELSFAGPCMEMGDLNGDGRADVFIGGGTGQSASLFLQKNDGTFLRKKIPDFTADQTHEDVDVSFFDADQDGDLDIYVASGGYHNFLPEDARLQDRLYFNDGAGNFSRNKEALPFMLSSTGAIAVADINGDEAPDIFVGGRLIPGRYPEAPTSYLLINDGKGAFSNQIKELAPHLEKRGMITDAAFADLNQDQAWELVIVGEWMPVEVHSWEKDKMKDQTSLYFKEAYKGWWNHILIEDVNQDQKPDLILGNMGLNTQFQVSVQEPAELYFKDFDSNGAIDPIFCFYVQGKSYPYLTRDELLGQLAYLRSTYTSFESYAGEQIQDIFPEKVLEDVSRLEATHMNTSLFVMGEDGKLEPKSLPKEVQYAPIYAATTLDFNHDGKKDLLLCGNNSHTKLSLGKFDANYGVLLEGDGRGNFSYVPQNLSGLRLKGDVRSMLYWEDNLLFGINGSPVLSYKLNEE